jgi:hypothetical protein
LSLFSAAGVANELARPDATITVLDTVAAPPDASLVVDAGAAPVGVNATPDEAAWWADSWTKAQSGSWTIRLGLILTVFVWGLRKWATVLPKFFRTDTGGPVLVFGLAILGSVAHALLANTTPNKESFFTAIQVGAVAIATYVTSRKAGLVKSSSMAQPLPLPPPPSV